MEDIPNKSPGDLQLSTENNSFVNELKNLIQSANQVLSGADLFQIPKSVANYSGAGDFYNDTGAANAYVLTVPAPRNAPTALENGLRARFIPSSNNTGASTVNVAGFGIRDIKKYGGTVDVEQGDIVAGRITELNFISSLDDWELVSTESPIVAESIPLFMTISEMAISTSAGGDPLTDIDIAPGTFKDTSSLSAFTQNTLLTKQLDIPWAEGTNAGGRASSVPYLANKWYHVFGIAKPDGTTDAGCDDSLSASNLLADATGYTSFRRLWSIKTEELNTNIIPFYTKVSAFSGQREFYWIGDPNLSKFTQTNPSDATPTNLITLTPLGVEVMADVTIDMIFSAGNANSGEIELSLKSPLRGAGFFRKLGATKQTDPSVGEQFTMPANDVLLYTNSSSQLIWEVSVISGVATDLTIGFRTNGWKE